MDSDPPPEALEEIEKAFQSLSLHPADTPPATSTVGVLADASRWHPETRAQLADPHVLRLLVSVVEISIHDAIETAELALRCIGNACIDNNTASQDVTDLGFSWAKQCLPAAADQTGTMGYARPDPKVAMLTAKVLYNICADYEPAQREYFNAHVHHQLIALCTFEQVIASDEKPLFLELLFWICSHAQPDRDGLPPAVLKQLLSLPGLFQETLTPDDSALLVETCLTYLREPAAKQDILERECVEEIWQMLVVNEDLIDRLEESDEDRKLLPPLSTALIWVLSDLAASPEFQQSYNLTDEWIEGVLIPTVDANCKTLSSPRLVDAACQVLGNLVWSGGHQPTQSAGKYGVQTLAIPLLSLLQDDKDTELLHSAAGLLVQLTRSFPVVRQEIGADSGTHQIIEQLCGNRFPQIKQDGIALLRALGKDSPENQQRYADLAKAVLEAPPATDTAMIEV